jgi:transmembrane sensor
MNWIRRAWEKIRRFYSESRIFRAATQVVAVVTVTSPFVHVALIVYQASLEARPKLSGSLEAGMGEYRCITLSEGTRLCANSGGKLHYNFTNSARTVEVDRGEVSVLAGHDGRPLDLVAGRLLVHDLSTGFVVDRQDRRIHVTVTDGRVRVVAPLDSQSRMKFQRGEAVSAWRGSSDLRKYQQVEFDEATWQLRTLPDATELVLQQLQSWEEGRILLDGRTLDEAIYELRRYQKLPQFEYAPDIGDTPLGGEIVSDSLDAFLEALEYQFHIHPTKKNIGSDEVIVLTHMDEK